MVAPRGATPVDLPTAQFDPGFVDRLAERLRGRVDQARGTIYQDDNRRLSQKMLRLLGEGGAGTIYDILGEAARSGAYVVSDITPDFIERPVVGAAQNVGSAILDARFAPGGTLRDFLGGVAEQYGELEQRYPETTRNVEAGAALLSLLTPVKSPAGPAPQTVAGRAAETLKRSGLSQERRSKRKFLQDLVTPKQTASIRRDQVSRTIQKGPLKRNIVLPSKQQKQAMRVLGEIEGINPSNSTQKNFNVARKELSKEASALSTTLEQARIPVPKKRILAVANKAKQDLAKNPLIVGDAEKIAEKINQQLNRILQDTPGTAAGVLEARKKIDKYITSYKPNVFDTSSENAFVAATRSVRGALNDLLDDVAKKSNIPVDVKRSLKKQSSLYRATDAMETVAADEALNSVMRVWQSAKDTLPIHGDFIRNVVATAGLGGGAAYLYTAMNGTLAATLAGAGAVYGLQRAIGSPQAKIILSRLLEASDDLIRISKDKNVIRGLRADRAAILELLKSSEEVDQVDDADNIDVKATRSILAPRGATPVN